MSKFCLKGKHHFFNNQRVSNSCSCPLFTDTHGQRRSVLSIFLGEQKDLARNEMYSRSLVNSSARLSTEGHLTST